MAIGDDLCAQFRVPRYHGVCGLNMSAGLARRDMRSGRAFPGVIHSSRSGYELQSHQLRVHGDTAFFRRKLKFKRHISCAVEIYINRYIARF